MLRRLSRYSGLVAALAIGLALSLAAIDVAEARRASGGFGSRGSRTFDTPSVTRTAPSDASPINRTMTQQNSAQPQRNVGQQQAQRPGLFGGFGRTLFGGLLLGGLFGMLLGGGFGGMMGFLGMLLQIALIVGLGMLLMRFLANRRQASAYPAGGNMQREAYAGAGGNKPGFQIPTMGSGSAATPRATKPVTQDIQLSPADLDRFEALLTEVQTAYGREDYPALRRLATPEAMSYLAEELGDNATNGVRNTVSDVKLLQGDISEAWREGPLDYATLAMRYSSIDALVDRTTGKVVDGDAVNPSETVELWTFVRKSGTDWQLSAIQSA